jgi:pyruvate formate lyase activating enzyme
MKDLTRRELFKCGAGFLTSLSFSSLLAREATVSAQKGFVKKREAMYYEDLGKKSVRCTLCPKMCFVGDRGRGYCGVRENVDGKYYSLVFGNPCAIHVDPIEKKPLFHYLPSTGTLSLATAGCNMECKYCQNWQISQAIPEETYNYDLPPQAAVDLAEREDCRSIAYTYTEPMVFYEYVLETAKIAQEKDIKNVLVTNGFISPHALKELCKFVDAANVDLKGFTEDYYGQVCRGVLSDVLNSLKIYRERGVHLEITNLVVPTRNDDMEMIERMSTWIRDELGEDVPLHFSRFTPMYKLKNLYLTPVETLERARTVAMDVGLQYVYIGNVPGHVGENTYCPNCGKMIIDRTGFSVHELNLRKNACQFCKHAVSGVWD